MLICFLETFQGGFQAQGNQKESTFFFAGSPYFDAHGFPTTKECNASLAAHLADGEPQSRFVAHTRDMPFVAGGLLACGWKGAKELHVSKFALKEGGKELPGVLQGHGSLCPAILSRRGGSR